MPPPNRIETEPKASTPPFKPETIRDYRRVRTGKQTGLRMGSKPRKKQPTDQRTSRGGWARRTCQGHARDRDGTTATWHADGRKDKAWEKCIGRGDSWENEDHEGACTRVCQEDGCVGVWQAMVMILHVGMRESHKPSHKIVFSSSMTNNHEGASAIDARCL